VTEVSVRAPRGYRGARLGPPYEFKWIDQEPTKQKWSDLAEKRGCIWAAVGLLVTFYVAFLVGGVGGFALAILLSAFLGQIYQMIGSTRGRRDDEPVPKAVHREAWIEHEDGVFYFTLAVDGKPEIWQPWELVGQFERADYWSMFGDAGASPYKTGWHAIVMTPPVGRPWLIASTIEAEGEVRDRFSKLDARFSADARTRFMRQVEVQKKKSPEANQLDTSANPSGVPDRL
jgi:hypothetical protein